MDVPKVLPVQRTGRKELLATTLFALCHELVYECSAHIAQVSEEAREVRDDQSVRFICAVSIVLSPISYILLAVLPW